MAEESRWRTVVQDLWYLRAPIVIVFTPLVLLPILLTIQTSEASCAFVVLLMAVYWTSEMIPLAATALLPAILFPLLGVMSAGDVCRNYIKDTSMLYLGGLLVAIAIEKLNLHKRIALRVLMVFGADPKWLVMGMMLPTWLLSMWISNTATSAMMVPIASAVLMELRANQSSVRGTALDPEVNNTLLGEVQGTNADTELQKSGNNSDTEKTQEKSDNYGTFVISNNLLASHENSTVSNNSRGNNASCETIRIGVRQNTSNATSGSLTPEDEEYPRLCKAMMLSIAYAANVGGLATLTGTPPNLVLQGQADIVFKKYGSQSPITYTNWMIFALPLSILCFFCTWIWILLFFLRKRFWRKVSVDQRQKVKRIIRGEYQKLGTMTSAEITVLVLFILLALLWLTRNPVFIPGWGALFKDGYVKDSTPAMFVALLLFILPNQFPRVLFCRKSRGRPEADYSPILDWNTVTQKMPWGIILLFGGGFALADGCQKSGLSRWVGDQLAGLSNLDPWVTNLILTFIVGMATEFTSNLATATLLLPILADLALVLGLNPLYFMMSAVVATSFAFMLPVATPPNAIVFSHGHLKVTDMASAGFVMNILSILLLNLAINTWANAYFDLHVQPDIFQELPNSTLSTPPV
ncbi:solute carrier family 13 member 2-like [Liolophura sinensis]|uniref:solute carrier family 13 member 2-like n=1 Tax=Liolophura sinensis TaxID=3198878 RepID=UPI0031582597